MTAVIVTVVIATIVMIATIVLDVANTASHTASVEQLLLMENS
jgi:hypothetical protein